MYYDILKFMTNKKEKPKTTKKSYTDVILELFNYQQILIFYGVSAETYKKEIREIIKDDDFNNDDSMCDGRAQVLLNKKMGTRIYYVWTAKKYLPTLAHELSHIIHFLFEDLGIEEASGNEMFAYVIGYLLERVLDDNIK